HASTVLDLAQQVALGLLVCLENLGQRDVGSMTQGQLVPTPLGYVPVVERREGGRRPAHTMHAIRDRVDGLTREHLLGDLTVALRDTVYVARPRHRQHRHVELAM